MGTCIEAAVATSRRGRIVGRGALHLSDAAATACLREAGHRADEIDLLINAGIYKDRNTAEPALAAIIQEDIGANADGSPQLGRHGTFSFDVMNGGCGVITAAQLAAGFVSAGRAQLALIVAADADPSPRTSRRFPFDAAGGALLLAHRDDEAGFVQFETRTFPDEGALFESRLRWDPNAALGLGRNILDVEVAYDLADRCVTRAAEVATDVLARASLAGGDIDLLIASQYPRSFALEVAAMLHIPARRVPLVPRELARAHTAGPIVALAAAMRSGAWQQARHTLFVAAGAGLTISVALYRNAVSAASKPSSS
jgi:3-oxoacyl-[acyl-carrier-protein] synthase-3